MLDLPSEPAAATAFDLFSLTGTVVLLTIFSVSGLYALGDIFFVEAHLPAGAMPHAGFIAAGLTGIAAAVWLSRGAPPVERFVLSLLLGLSLASAACPLMLRINRITADAVPETVAYRQAGAGEYAALDPAYPAIRFNARYTELLAGAPADAVRSFELFRGALGFYQLDLHPLRDELILRRQLDEFVEQLKSK